MVRLVSDICVLSKLQADHNSVVDRNFSIDHNYSVNQLIPALVIIPTPISSILCTNLMFSRVNQDRCMWEFAWILIRMNREAQRLVWFWPIHSLGSCDSHFWEKLKKSLHGCTTTNQEMGHSPNYFQSSVLGTALRQKQKNQAASLYTWGGL